MAVLTTKYRSLTTLKNSSGLTQLEDTVRWTSTVINGLAVAAEDYLNSFGSITTITASIQGVFDSACRELILWEVAEPARAVETKADLITLKFTSGAADNLLAVKRWKALAANAGVIGGMRQSFPTRK